MEGEIITNKRSKFGVNHFGYWRKFSEINDFFYRAEMYCWNPIVVSSNILTKCLNSLINGVVHLDLESLYGTIIVRLITVPVLISYFLIFLSTPQYLKKNGTSLLVNQPRKILFWYLILNKIPREQKVHPLIISQSGSFIDSTHRQICTYNLINMW